MAASLMIKEWGGKDFEITLIVSADIGAIGVGEGSTPPMREFFSSEKNYTLLYPV